MPLTTIVLALIVIDCGRSSWRRQDACERPNTEFERDTTADSLNNQVALRSAVPTVDADLVISARILPGQKKRAAIGRGSVGSGARMPVVRRPPFPSKLDRTSEPSPDTFARRNLRFQRRVLGVVQLPTRTAAGDTTPGASVSRARTRRTHQPANSPAYESGRLDTITPWSSTRPRPKVTAEVRPPPSGNDVPRAT